jgi:hypothetical protein
MWAGWVIAGCVIGAIAGVVVWTLIVAIAVVRVEEHHRHDGHSEDAPTDATDTESPKDRVSVP